MGYRINDISVQIKCYLAGSHNQFYVIIYFFPVPLRSSYTNIEQSDTIYAYLKQLIAFYLLSGANLFKI